MKKHVITALSATILLSIAPQAQATDWVYLDTNVDGDTWYVDKDSIKMANFTYGGKYAMAWLKVDFAKAQDDGDGKKYCKSRLLHTTTAPLVNLT